ncbi:MAG TPA: SDR family oxidoreductase [Stellaceae bacterium]|nr:SDR family oxidoreductase [Stellaceae bacterium]
MTSFKGKVVFITGAGTGIGRGTAELFAEAGANVVIAGRREQKVMEVAAASGGRITHVRMDLQVKADRDHALEIVLERHGRLDVLVNNAAHQLWKPFMEQTEQEIHDVAHTNLISAAQLIQRAVPHLQKTRGNIVNISSTAGRWTPMPSQHLSTYGASKAGINHLTRSLASELGPLGIRINAVAPGLTHAETSSVTASNPQLKEMLEGMTALGRIGEPVDIARVVLFLASDQAGWVTGQVIDASGGWQVAGG